MNKLLRSFFAIAGGRLGVLFVGILVTPIIVRLLGSANYGDYAFLGAMLTIITTFTARGGVTSGVRKFIAEDREYNSWESQVFGIYFQISIILTGIAALLIAIYTSTEFAEIHFSSTFIPYLYLLAVLVIADQMFGLVRSTLIAFDYEHISEPLGILKKAVYGGTAIALLYFGWGVSGVLIGRIIGASFAAIICLIILTRFINLRKCYQFTSDEFPRREIISFNFTSLILLFLLTSLYNIDLLMLQPIAGSEQTGYYKAALVVAEFLWFVPHAAQISLLHSMSEFWENNRINKISNTVSNVTRYTTLFTVLLIIGLGALAEPFITLYYGADFTPAVVPLLILLPGALGFAISRPILSTSQAKGNLRPPIIATGFAAVINLLLNAVLIPSYGMYGAATATSIGYGSMIMLHIWSANQIGFDPLQDLRLSRIIITGMMTACVVFPLAWLVRPSLFSLAIVPPVGFLVFILSAWKTKAISNNEAIRIKTAAINKVLS